MKRAQMYTYNIAATDGTHMKEYIGFRCTVDATDEKALVKMVRVFCMSYFGAWFQPVVITKKNIDLFQLYLKYKDVAVGVVTDKNIECG